MGAYFDFVSIPAFLVGWFLHMLAGMVSTRRPKSNTSNTMHISYPQSCTASDNSFYIPY